MANIQERRDKNGKLISYSIRVHRGRRPDRKQLKPWTATFAVNESWTEKGARKKAEAFAAVFEKECREGVTSDSRQTFQSYCNYVLETKEARGAKHSTIVRYRELTGRIYPAIGHIKLKDLRADHLNSLYTALGKEGSEVGSVHATAKVDLACMKTHQRQLPPTASSRCRLRQCSYCGNTGHGRARNGYACGATIRIRASCSPRTTEGPCTRTM